MFEIEKKYRLPAGKGDELTARLNTRFGPPEVLREEDLHGFTSPERHYLRLRRSGEHLWLIAKGPTTTSPEGVRSRREVEVPLANEAFEVARDLVELLRTEALPGMLRWRHAWHLGRGAELVVDRLDALPEEVFAELEVLGTDSDAAHRQLARLEVELGLNPDWRELRSYAQILSEVRFSPS